MEGASERAVRVALDGFIGVYLNQPLTLIPVSERTQLLRYQKSEEDVKQDTWVRIKSGRYKGDACYVNAVDCDGASRTFEVLLVPRISYEPQERRLKGKGKRAKNHRAPRQLFEPDIAREVYGQDSVQPHDDGMFRFEGQIFAEGLLSLMILSSDIAEKNISPTPQDLDPFTESQYFGHIMQPVLGKQAIEAFCPNEQVEIIQGEESGLRGHVEDINQGIATISLAGHHLAPDSIPSLSVPIAHLRRYFAVGDPIRVVAGSQAGRNGLVVRFEGDVVTAYEPETLDEVCSYLITSSMADSEG